MRCDHADGATKRDTFLDYLKGLGILAVVGTHALSLVPMRAPAFDDAQPLDRMLRFAVPFFFGVLGYLTVTRFSAVRRWGPFFQVRAVRLLAPYVCWSVLYALGTPVLVMLRDPGPIGRIFSGYAEGHLYFMVAYFGFLVLLPATAALLRAAPRGLSATAAIAGICGHAALLVGLERALDAGDLGSWYIDSEARLPVHWMAFWCAGVLAGLGDRWLRAWAVRARTALVLASVPALALYVYALHAYTADGSADWFGYSPASLWTAALAFCALASLYPLVATRGGGALAWVGRRSFAIYLSHPLVLRWLAAPVAETGGAPWAVAAAAAASLAGALGYAFFHERFFGLGAPCAPRAKIG
jgi:fucose 4-O-acetylase-like acetyltransferase